MGKVLREEEQPTTESREPTIHEEFNKALLLYTEQVIKEEGELNLHCAKPEAKNRITSITLLRNKMLELIADVEREDDLLVYLEIQDIEPKYHSTGRWLEMPIEVCMKPIK